MNNGLLDILVLYDKAAQKEKEKLCFTDTTGSYKGAISITVA